MRKALEDRVARRQRKPGQEIFGIGDQLQSALTRAVMDEALKQLPIVDRLLHGREVTVTVAMEPVKIRLKLE